MNYGLIQRARRSAPIGTLVRRDGRFFVLRRWAPPRRNHIIAICRRAGTGFAPSSPAIMAIVKRARVVSTG
jgi:hypothetical protein